MAETTGEEEFHQMLAARLAADIQLLNGNARPTQALFSRRDDATLLGAAGGFTKGGENAAERLGWVAAQSVGGTTAYEHVASGVTADMAYTVSIQLGDQLFAGVDTAMQSELRVTEIYRREDGEWRLVHRHAEPLVRLQRPGEPRPEAG